MKALLHKLPFGIRKVYDIYCDLPFVVISPFWGAQRADNWYHSQLGFDICLFQLWKFPLWILLDDLKGVCQVSYDDNFRVQCVKGILSHISRSWLVLVIYI